MIKDKGNEINVDISGFVSPDDVREIIELVKEYEKSFTIKINIAV